MVFVHPQAWWALVALLPLVVVHARHRMNLRAGRAVIVTMLRALALVLLIAALARPVIERHDPSRTVVSVVDVSSSVDDAALRTVEKSLRNGAPPGTRDRAPDDEIHQLVVFDRSARRAPLDEVVSGDRPMTSLRAPANPAGSSLADALALAGALIPHDGQGAVRLYSDGLESGGDALAEAHRLADRGIPVRTMPVRRDTQQEVILQSVTAPAYAVRGAEVEIRANVESSKSASARLIVGREGSAEAIASPVMLKPGLRTLTHQVALRDEGLARYTVSVESVHDTLEENNHLTAAILVGPPPRVMVLEADATAPSAGALAVLLGRSARVTPLTPADLRDPESLANADVLVVADTPTDAVGIDGWRRVRDEVTKGLGLLVTGGRGSFGPGGYADTPLAEILPVRFAQDVEQRDPSTTLVVIIDTSGSMGGARVNLAKEIARLAIARLKPHDKVGIVEFYGTKRWAAPIQPASNAIDLQRALNRLSAGGGTVILPAIDEAYYALQDVRTRTKHVLVLTDGGVESGAFEPLLRKMADARMTVSTVLVGPAAHSAFLARLAHWGRGRFYTAPDRFHLPEVITKQPESSLLSPWVETPVALLPRTTGPIVRHVPLADAPRITGYVRTDARATANVIATTSLGHPVLARWQYGLGAVAVLTTQLSGEWSAELVEWPPYATLLSNVVRSLRRPNPEAALRVVPVLRPGALEVRIVNQLARDGDGFSAAELTATADCGESRRWVVDPIAPDRWNARVEHPCAGIWEIRARTLDGEFAGAAAVSVPAPREVTALSPNQTLLDAIAGYASVADRRAVELSAVAKTRATEIWPSLVLAALVLFFLDVLIRRWPPRRYAAAPSHAALGLVLLAGFSAIPQTAAAQPDAGSPATATDERGDAFPILAEALRGERPAEADKAFASAIQQTLERDGSLDALVAFLRGRSETNPLAKRQLADALRKSGALRPARDVLADFAAQQSRTRQEVDENAGVAVWAELGCLEESLGHDDAALAAYARSISAETDPRRRFALSVRSALIQYAQDDREAAGRMLRTALAAHPEPGPAATLCAHLAALNGDYRTALELLEPMGSGKQRCTDHLFRGDWLMRLDQSPAAEQEFRDALEHAALGRDRRYAVERQVAAARHAGTLDALADRWLSTETRSRIHLRALIGVLRERERFDDALRLVRLIREQPDAKALTDLSGLQHEVIALALEAGKEDAAKAFYRDLIAKNPDELMWRGGLARLLLLEGRRDAAGRLMQERMERCTDPGELLALAQAARELALRDVALHAARKAGESGRSARIEAVLFEADLAREQGDGDRAMTLLRQVSNEPPEDDAVLLRVAETLERYGDPAEALRLLQLLYRRTQGEDLLLRIAWLMEENQRVDEALTLWKNLWRTTASPARAHQSQVRLLDLAARSGKLADLVIELEERIDDGAASERDFSLLVQIYTSVNDTISASEILHQYTKMTGDQVDAAQRLVQVYLSCDRFGRCDATLRKLIKLDPDNTAEYLMQIAMLALERSRVREARAALRDLADVADDPSLVEEFSAGVLDMLGLHAEAARRYQRLLARNPDRIEALLLWGNAMRAGGYVEHAVGRYQNLLETAVEDDLFAVAVDGLLNLDAAPAVLRAALRRIYSRIAAYPTKVFLYRLAIDVLEALRQPESVSRVLGQAVVVAGERRGALLREAMAAARAEQDHVRLVDVGRSLIALTRVLPPDVYLEIGEAMLKQNRFAAAERVFERAADGADRSGVQQRVARHYEDAGLPEHAIRVVRTLLVTDPDDISLKVHAGDLNAQLGHFERAYEHYSAVVDLLLRRLPSVIGRMPAPGDSGAKRQRRPRRAADLDEIDQYLESTVVALLETARTDALQRRLLREMTENARRTLDALSTNGLTRAAIAAHPQLARTTSYARRIAFALHAPDLADALDRELLNTFPNDKALRSEIVQSRIDWGLHERANRLAQADSTAAPLPVALAVERLLANPTAWQNTRDEPLESKVAGALVARLIMLGRDDDARRVLRAPTTVPADAGIAETAATMLAAATTLDDPDAFRAWLYRWFGAIERGADAQKIGAQLARCLSLTWNHLTAPEQQALIARIDRLAESLGRDARPPLDLLRLRWANRMGIELADRDRVIRDACGDADTPVGTLAEVLELAPAGARATLLHRMVAARRPGSVRKFLLDLVGHLRAPSDTRLTDAFVALFKAAPAPRVEPRRAYTFISAGGWNRNPHAVEVGRRLGEVLISEQPDDVHVLTAAALARENAGEHDQAILLANEALDMLLTVRRFQHQHRRMLADLIAIMQPGDLDTALAELGDREEIEGATPNLLLAKAQMLLAADRTEAGIAALRSAFTLAPSDRAMRRSLITALRRQGAECELANLLASHLRQATIMETYEWRTLGTLYANMHRPHAALAAARKDETPLRPVYIMRAARMMGDQDLLRTTFRRFLASRRNAARGYRTFWPADVSPGGMTAYLADQTPRASRRLSLFAALADRPFARAEYAALLSAVSPEGRDISGLVEGLAQATNTTDARSELLDRLGAASRRGALTIMDQQLMIALGEADAAAFPKELAKDWDTILVHTDPADTETLATLARIHRARGASDRAWRILRWVVARDLLTGQRETWLERRLERFDDYLAVVPDAQRPAERRRILRQLAPTPFADIGENVQAALLERWTASPEDAETEALLQRLRTHVRESPSPGPRRLIAALARTDARAGRLDAFTEWVDRLRVPSTKWEPLDTPIDARQCLPPKAELSAPAEYVNVLRAAIASRSDRTDGAGLTPSATVQSYCLLGKWCAENGLRDEARALVESAQAVSANPSASWLWIADLARSADDDDRAVEIELRLLKQRLLPIARVPELLLAVEAREGGDNADALAAEVAEYSDHPAILRRAVRRAEAAGDAAAAQRLRDRLPAPEPGAVESTPVP